VGSDDLGILMTLMGAGALVATLILASMSRFRHRGLLLLVSCVVWGVGLALFSQATSFAVAVPYLLAVGLVSSLFMSLNMTLFQVYAAREMRGRVMSIGMMTFGLTPLSALPFGALAESIGTPDALMVSGLLLTAGSLILIIALPNLRRIA
jgi:predicted MFS family arabinose efflux permease